MNGLSQSKYNNVANSAGLNQAELEHLLTVFKQFPNIATVILFGSRAKGNFRFNSDIDLAIEGHLDELEIEKLAMALDELPMPYRFDLVLLSDISNPSLLDHIKRVGSPVYSSSERLHS